jgi:hypothetical protein
VPLYQAMYSHDCAPGGGPGGPGLQVEQLAFDRGEERLGQGVVPALAGAAMGQGYLAVGSEVGEFGGGVLAAPAKSTSPATAAAPGSKNRAATRRGR